MGNVLVIKTDHQTGAAVILHQNMGFDGTIGALAQKRPRGARWR
jgi:hypothetical protein